MYDVNTKLRAPSPEKALSQKRIMIVTALLRSQNSLDISPASILIESMSLTAQGHFLTIGFPHDSASERNLARREVTLSNQWTKSLPELDIRNYSPKMAWEFFLAHLPLKSLLGQFSSIERRERVRRNN